MVLPDVELALTAWVAAEFGVAVCTELPADLTTRMPLVQVVGVGGPGGRFSADPRVDVDAYAATYEEARDLLAAVHAELMRLRGVVDPIVIRDVRGDSVPSRRPYGNSALRRVGASYTISARSV